jgi:glycosyltransferase involved in cell wall biosynthesis
MSSTSGWGVYGLNIGLNWAADPDVVPVFAVPNDPTHIFLDPLRAKVLAPVLEISRKFASVLEPHAGSCVRVSGTVVHALGTALHSNPAAHNTVVTGESMVGAVFFDHTTFDTAAHDRARQYELIITGSTWNQQVLERNGIGPVATVLQGIDPTLFHPAERTGMYKDRFLVFSGGKLEHRKGQDLALLAFKGFAARHPEALLVTAWHCPWPDLAGGIDCTNSLAGPVPFDDTRRPDVGRWAAANGVAPECILDLGQVPNMLMPAILREMDVAVFPNRCEGGTNLVAMECMACAVPTILSANTGHLDLITPQSCIPLTRQSPIVPRQRELGTDEWGESDVEEIVEALERVWRDRDAAATMGATGARALLELTWARQTRRLKEAILPYMP